MPNMKDDEESMLDQAFNVKSESRLGCQIEYNDSFNGLKLTLPPK
jgi:2Fe-2S ferredoxin